MRALFSRLFVRGRALWERALRERSSPPEVGLSVGVGVFAACTPLLGAHAWIALGLATLLRLNRLWAFLASRVSITPIFVLISFTEIEAAHRLRTGAWADLTPSRVLAHGRELAVDWVLGTAVVGGSLAVLTGLSAYAAARRWRGDLTRRTPPEAPAPSSGSPPSAPPAPTP